MASSELLQLNKSIVLVGLMGCGKSSVGKRLAKEIGVDFVDIDKEIENDEELTVSKIFKKYGEEYFRKAEKDKIDEVLSSGSKVIATGGGAFMNELTRELIKKKAYSVWIKADIETLLERVSRKDTRPLLRNGNKEEILKDLIDKRYPVYKEADFAVETSNGPHGVVVKKIINVIKNAS